MSEEDKTILLSPLDVAIIATDAYFKGQRDMIETIRDSASHIIETRLSAEKKAEATAKFLKSLEFARSPIEGGKN